MKEPVAWLRESCPTKRTKRERSGSRTFLEDRRSPPTQKVQSNAVELTRLSKGNATVSGELFQGSDCAATGFSVCGLPGMVCLPVGRVLHCGRKSSVHKHGGSEDVGVPSRALHGRGGPCDCKVRGFTDVLQTGTPGPADAPAPKGPAKFVGLATTVPAQQPVAHSLRSGGLVSPADVHALLPSKRSPSIEGQGPGRPETSHSLGRSSKTQEFNECLLLDLDYHKDLGDSIHRFVNSRKIPNKGLIFDQQPEQIAGFMKKTSGALGLAKLGELHPLPPSTRRRLPRLQQQASGPCGNPDAREVAFANVGEEIPEDTRKEEGSPSFSNLFPKKFAPKQQEQQSSSQRCCPPCVVRLPSPGSSCFHQDLPWECAVGKKHRSPHWMERISLGHQTWKRLRPDSEVQPVQDPGLDAQRPNTGRAPWNSLCKLLSSPGQYSWATPATQ